MNIILNHKRKFIILICLVLFYVTWKSKFFNKTEFVVLEQMTRIDSTENQITEIILIKNHPKSSNELKEMIQEFNSKRQIKFEKIKQIFIKEHAHKFLPALTLSENYSYEDRNTDSDKLDNIDFLAERDKYTCWNKREVDTIHCFVGKYDYHKE